MPLYEFRCEKCDSVFEHLCRAGSNGRGLKCPKCDSARLRRLMSVFSARSKGEGGSRTSVGSSCSTCTSDSCATCR